MLSGKAMTISAFCLFVMLKPATGARFKTSIVFSMFGLSEVSSYL